MPNLSNTPDSGNGQRVGSKTVAVEADATPSRVSQEFHDFVADVEDLITETTSITGDDLVRVKTKLSERVKMAKESIQDMSSDIAQRARRTATVTNNYVHDQPWAAVGIGTAVGVLFGFLLGRRK